MPQNYGTYTLDQDVPRRKDVEAVRIAAGQKVPLSGGTMTGILTAQSNTGYTTAQVRNEKLLPKADFDAVTDWTAQLGSGCIAWCYE